MTLIKRNTPQRSSFNGLLDNFFNDGFNPWMDFNQHKLPAVNIEEFDDSFKLEVEAPGFNKGDFKVEVHNDKLHISAQVEEKKEEKKEHYSRREFSTSSFQRSFVIGKNTINADAISAAYENGILQLTLPKKDEVKPQPSRLIDIK
jgi:HSP20 family protein